MSLQGFRTDPLGVTLDAELSVRASQITYSSRRHLQQHVVH